MRRGRGEHGGTETRGEVLFAGGLIASALRVDLATSRDPDGQMSRMQDRLPPGLWLPSPRMTPEENVDVRRYLSAIARSKRLILLILFLVTGAVVAISLLLPDNYEASTAIVIDENDPG